MVRETPNSRRWWCPSACASKPGQKVCRWTLGDSEFTAETQTAQGRIVVVLLGAANRDPARF